MKAVVYQIVNLSNKKCYVGSTNNLSRRKRAHFYDLRLNKHHSISLQRAYNKYGKESFRMFVLESFDASSREEILKKEQYYLDFLKPEYNICKIAGTQEGHTRSDEFKQKMSKLIKEKYDAGICKAWNKGLKGYRKHDEETLKRMRASHKNHNAVKVIQKDLSGNVLKVWDSLKQVSRELPCSHTTLCNHINGKSRSKLKTFKGYLWSIQ